MKRKILSLLSVVLLISVLLSTASILSCAKDNQTTGDDIPSEDQSTTNAEENVAVTENPFDIPNLPDEKYDGYKFRIVNSANDSINWLLTQLTSEGETGDVMNDAIYRRNRVIEERYNITITESILTDFAAVKAAAMKSAKGGSDDYDIVMLQAADSLTMAQSGLTLEMHEIPNIDFTKHYWDQDMIRDLSIANKIYFTSGDFSFTPYSSTISMFFNKKMHENFGLEDPYALVKSGNWTYDKFLELARGASLDVNGDGTYDKNDQYGYMSLNFVFFPAWIISGGEKFVKKDENDMPYPSVGGSERFVQVFEKILNTIHTENIFFDADLAGDHRLQDIMFPGNQALFWSELMNWSKILRDMDSDFGILPHPKFEASQPNYTSIVFNPSFIQIPITVPDPARTGCIIEALCAESKKSVKPVYYETMLKTKISRDSDSGEMLDIMFANRVYDMGNLFWAASTCDPYIALEKKNDLQLASAIEKNLPKAESAIAKTVEAFEK